MKRGLKLTVFALSVLIMAHHGLAQRNSLGFFINAAGYFTNSDDIKSGFGTGLGAVFYPTQNMALSLEWKYGRFDVDYKEGEFVNGSLSMTPILISFRFHLRTGTSFTPYVFGGGGIFLNYYRLDKSANLGEGNIRRQDVKNGIGFMGGIGSSVMINEKMNVFFEGLFLQRTTEVETIFTDNSPSITFHANLNSFSILIGLNYFY